MAHKGRTGKRKQQPKRTSKKRAAIVDDSSDDGEGAAPAANRRSPRHEPVLSARNLCCSGCCSSPVPPFLSQPTRAMWRPSWRPLLQQELSGRGAVQTAEMVAATKHPTSPTRAYTVSGEMRASDGRTRPRSTRILGRARSTRGCALRWAGPRRATSNASPVLDMWCFQPVCVSGPGGQDDHVNIYDQKMNLCFKKKV